MERMRLKVCLKNKTKVWEEHEKTLLNTPNKWRGELGMAERIERLCGNISKSPVETALGRIKTGKAAGCRP